MVLRTSVRLANGVGHCGAVSAISPHGGFPMPSDQPPEERTESADLTAAERKARLDEKIGRIMLRKDRHLEYRSDFQAIIRRGRRLNHILHLLLTLCTFGFWFFVWICLAIGGGESRAVVKINQQGKITVAQL